MTDLDVKAMDWARREADRLVFATNTIREMRDAIKDALLSAHEAGRAAGPEWRPISEAPKDGTVVLVWAAPFQDLPGFQSTASYHPDAGWCVDELREVTHFLPLPTPPKETGA